MEEIHKVNFSEPENRNVYHGYQESQKKSNSDPRDWR
jgi:hypothetical protein